MGFCFLFIDFRCIRITNSFKTGNRMNGTNTHKLSVICEENDYENSIRQERTLKQAYVVRFVDPPAC